MEIVSTEFIEEFEKDMDNVIPDTVYVYTLSKIIYEDETVKYEVDIEIAGYADVFEPKYFDTEKRAREYINGEI